MMLRFKLFVACFVSFLFAFAVTLALLTLISPARAHDWYPLSCCSEKDCWQAGKYYDQGAREPEPKAVKGGWLLFDGTIVPYDKTRVSPDGNFHVCRRGGTLAGKVIEAGKVCLWVPGQLS
jgi:hypothetical protein